jgi:autotransporter-associated beta strand protein
MSPRHLLHLSTVLLLSSPHGLLMASSITWTNGNGNTQWSTAGNWDPATEPNSSSEILFPADLAGTITTTTTENALSLRFEGNYTLSGGTLALATGNGIETTNGITASILNPLNITGGLTKTGLGNLILGGNNNNTGGTIIQQGTIRAQNTGALGGTGALTTINGGATLEIAGIALDRPIALNQGATLAGAGTATSNGVMTIDSTATLVHLGTSDASDLLTLGNASNDLTGGTSTSVIQPLGPGTVRLAAASNFNGSWLLDQGKLELGAATALGIDPARSLTLAGGTLSARVNSATSFTGSPANQILLTADSTILSDRVTATSGLTHTLGNLSMAAQTLTIAPGPSATSGTAGITLESLSLSGNPNFLIQNSGATGRLAIGALNGGASPRTITKSGPGELAVTGGTTTLVPGSSFLFSGGGLLDLIFPDLGSDTVITLSETQNPLGLASLSFTNGTLRLQANGSNNSTAQTYQLPNAITLGGEVTIDPQRRTNFGTNKTFELPGLTLAAGTELSISGTNSHGIRLSGTLALLGDAALAGVNVSNRSSLLTLNSGITGSMTDSLEIRGGTSPLNLTINAASTYGGGTTITGGNVTINAANALGSGTISIAGGSLRINGPDLLADSSILLNGGTLDLRNNTATDFIASSLTVSGNSTLAIGNNGTGTSQLITIPELNISGTTNLTFTNANSFTPLISNLSLAGDLTVTNTIAARIATITEDTSSRTLRTSGIGTLTLEGASDHSAGTEVLAGTLALTHQDSLGSARLTLGDTTGTAAATVSASAGLTIANDLLVRTGSSGTQTLSATGGNLTWSGNVELERVLSLSNSSSTLPSTLSGEITSTGTLTKTGPGEWILTNTANNFGSGENDAITINQGTLTAAHNSPLGNLANGITLTSSGLFRVNGTFESNRNFTFSGSGTTTGIDVTTGQILTLNSPISGSGTFNKSGPGTLVMAPTVDSSSTRNPAATTGISGGVIRLQSPKGLGNASPLTGTGGGTLELLIDANTDFAHPLTLNGAATVHVDRAATGSSSNGRHQLGALTLNANANLTVTGANGYGLTLPTATLQTSSPTLSNQSTSPLRIGELLANAATTNRLLTVGGTGDIEIIGAMSRLSGTGNINTIKLGPGSFRFGTSVSNFTGTLEVRDGLVDLNGLNHSVGLLTLGGAVSADGARIVTGAAGSLTLNNGLNFSTTGPAKDSTITGNVVLAPVSHTFSIPSSTAAVTEVTIDGPLTGSSGSTLTKTSAGILRLTGAGDNSPGPVAVNGGTLELAKTDGAQALGSDALTLNASTVRLLAPDQIPDTTPVTIGNTSTTRLDLNGFTETLGGATLSQSTVNLASILSTGAEGTLVLAGDLNLQNNGSSSVIDQSRNILITGTGNWSTPASNGTLDLGGATRTIHVTTNITSPNANFANATIETRIINGGILKTGSRTLVLTHPDNQITGGLQIAEGLVRVTNFGAIGGGPITFSSFGSGTAGLEFASLTGTFEEDLNLTASSERDISLIYSAPAPSTLTISGNIGMQSNLSVDVVNGFINDDSGALLDLTGTLDDGSESSSLVKLGQGILRLAAGNTYSGPTTVNRGVLSIPTENALGDTDATLTLDGGLLHATANITSPRNLIFGTAGGGLRIDSPGTLEFTGSIDWGSATTSFHGSGMTILSGESTGAGGDLLIGRPMSFATNVTSSLSHQNGQLLALRGDVTIPAGNIEFTNGAMLSLGTGDFIRPLGTGPGQFQMPTNTAVGWAAHGANRIVNIDGDEPIVWGQTSPRFLSSPATSAIGSLALSHATATHTVHFQSHIELYSSITTSNRNVIIANGDAELDAMLSGGFSNTPGITSRRRSLTFSGDGSAEISGPLTGEIHISKVNSGTLKLSGNNSSHTGSVYADDSSTIIFANDASFGAYDYIESWENSVIDASALSGPVTCTPPEDGYLGVSGTLIGDAISPSYFYGNGQITGDLNIPTEAYFEPGFDNTLHIGGDFTIEQNAQYGFYTDDDNGTLLPNINFNRIRVTGTVTLSGDFDLFASNLDAHIGETMVFILNDGDDPVIGQFTDLPQDATIGIGDGLALRITYQANGDGGSVPNDVGFTIVEGDIGPDVALAMDSPDQITPGQQFTITLTVSNNGPGDAIGIGVNTAIPNNAAFLSSVPAGDLVSGENGSQLVIELGNLTENATTQITLNFLAPGTDDTLDFFSVITGADSDADQDNNSAQTQVAVTTPPGAVELISYSFDPASGTGELVLSTVNGANYILQRSNNLDAWQDIGSYLGDGNLLIIPLTLDQAPEFFRIKLLPSIPENPPAS